MTEAIEDSARRIADQGRGELINQLRPAFEQAAQAHADVLELSPERLQEMIEAAAGRATGLQWRHALALVATRELDISLAEALGHPAVERAREIAGAPEDSVPVPAPVPAPAPREASPPADAAPSGTATTETEPAAETERIAPPDAEQDRIPESRSVREPRRTAEPRRPGEGHEPRRLGERQARRGRGSEDDQSQTSEGGPGSPRRTGAAVIRLAVVHVGGIANLAAGENGLELRLSPAGLDIGRGDGDMVGRLSWREIRSIDVPPPRGLRRKRQAGSQLVVRTPHGEASFEVPDLSPDELREQLRPMLARHQRRLRAR